MYVSKFTNMFSLDMLAVSGNKRPRITVDEQQASVHVIYNSLTRYKRKHFCLILPIVVQPRVPIFIFIFKIFGVPDEYCGQISYYFILSLSLTK